MELKYVIFDGAIPVIFPAMLLHADIAKSYPEHYPTSAGFLDNETLETFGESLSLDLSSKPEDRDTIKRYYTGRLGGQTPTQISVNACKVKA